jgi:hypothetical protein
MITRHSPSPWHYRVSDHDPDVWEIHAPFCESPIAEVRRWKDGACRDSAEAQGNVILIAAAPCLYETLSYVADLLSSFKPDFLRRIGLDAALEETLDALSVIEADIGRRS